MIAFGQGRSAQEKEIEWMRQYAPIYLPDMILYLFFCGNDFMENDPETFDEASSFGQRYNRKVAPRKIAFFRPPTMPVVCASGWYITVRAIAAAS